MQLGSNCLLNPLVRDEMFAARFNREKRRGLLLQRVKLDPFHWQDRYSKVMAKSHVLFGLFQACPRDAVCFRDQGDVEVIKERLIARGMENLWTPMRALNLFRNIRCYSPE
jgi:hypothetical protein